ncbi:MULTISPECIES: peptide-methionine (S)-S-oxide reductase MsrA [unclassified Acinetobacter]|uniref:peptide-methionine (S)-S-oxide reductase MsrA n=1 Tax=unclassified Acinetobacter TaxID=196816 RepID=UPI0035B85EC1
MYSQYGTKMAILGGGCFWCTEAVFLQVQGVKSVVSGYAGGTADTANYKAVCDGDTGHAEVIRIEFDEDVISFEKLLDIFFVVHDPTTLNRQGNDVGTQYRSVIFYLDENQHLVAEQKVAELKSLGVNIVTEISPAPTFYLAEEYHQNFYARNPTQGYCNAVIPAKLAKLRSHIFSQ